MTKRELLKVLGPLDDDTYIFVALSTAESPRGARIFIQEAVVKPPAHPPLDGLPHLQVALRCHEHNSELARADDADEPHMTAGVF